MKFVVTFTLVLVLLVACSDEKEEKNESAAVSVAFGQAVGVVTPTAANPTPETFGEWLHGDELAWYNRISKSAREDVEFFYSVRGYDETFEWLTTKVQKLDNGTYTTVWLPELTVPLPTPEESLNDKELARLKGLDDRLRAAFLRDWGRGAAVNAPEVEPLSRQVFVEGLIDEQFRQFRKGLRDTPIAIPPVEDLVLTDGLKVYESLNSFWQERFLEQVADRYLSGQATSGNMFPSFQDWATKNEYNDMILAFEPFIGKPSP